MIDKSFDCIHMVSVKRRNPLIWVEKKVIRSWSQGFWAEEMIQNVVATEMVRCAKGYYFWIAFILNLLQDYLSDDYWKFSIDF